MSLELNAISNILFTKTPLFSRPYKHHGDGIVFMRPVNRQREYELPQRYEKPIDPKKLSPLFPLITRKQPKLYLSTAKQHEDQDNTYLLQPITASPTRPQFTPRIRAECNDHARQFKNGIAIVIPSQLPIGRFQLPQRLNHVGTLHRRHDSKQPLCLPFTALHESIKGTQMRLSGSSKPWGKQVESTPSFSACYRAPAPSHRDPQKLYSMTPSCLEEPGS